MFVVGVLLAGIAVALIRRRLLAAAGAGAGAGSGDAPARLLGWAVGLLAADRAEWGQAMIGELDHITGRARRWRFAAGCVAGAMVLPPWGRAAAAAGSVAAVAAGGFGLLVYTEIRYGLGRDAGTWIWAAILLAVLAGYTVAAVALARRPGVAGPGLTGGLFVAAAWLAVSGWTFDRFLSPITAPWARPLLVIAVPAAVGAGVTLWGGSAAVGQSAARLAAVSAGLGLYLYGVLAVAAIGAGGPPGLPGATVAGNVSDRLGSQVVLALIVLPLVTATVGWGAAATTARLRRALRPAAAPALPVAGSGPAPAGAAAAAPPRHRAGYLLLLCATVAAAAILAFISWLPGR